MCSKIKFRSFSNNKDLYFLCFLLFISQVAFGQSGIWTWISGDSTSNAPGVYGTQGFPSIYNHPPGTFGMAEWKDKEGNFWVYGGTFPLSYNDLWKYNPLTNEWTWIKGTASVAPPPTYGIRGIPDPSNSPGERSLFAASWVDTSGNLWLFGGYEELTNAYKNDLWKYNIGTNNWTWMKGDSTINPAGVHGLQGSPDSLNTPGGRDATCSAWTDSLNNLWLFGGFGYDDNGIKGSLNDLMKYNISTNEWTWMKGSPYVNALANYGSKGIANVNNDPEARWSYTKWKDSSGNFWLMGGVKRTGDVGNDTWKYDLGLNEWIWMNGDSNSISEDSGHYGAYCLFDSSYLPAARFEHNSSVTDNCGRFWMFGGKDSADYNDLWVFDPSLLQWKWLSGARAIYQHGNYGKLGVPSASNMPPSAEGAVAWWGNDNKFYVLDAGVSSGALWVYNPDTSCVSMSCIPPPTAGFQSSKISICANDCIDFTNQSINATSWQWSFAGAADSTSTAQNPQNICYLTAGTFNVTLIASNSGGSASVTFSNYINVNPALSKPTINQVGNTLYCTTNPSYTSYQWSFDSVPIAGATDTFLVVSKSGNYTVAVTNENGCKVEVSINIIIGIQNYVSDNIISLYPNPATNQLTIRSFSFHNEAVTVSIMNVLGEVMQEEKRKWNNEASINIKALPAGIYFVQMKWESGSVVKRFVKE